MATHTSTHSAPLARARTHQPLLMQGAELAPRVTSAEQGWVFAPSSWRRLGVCPPARSCPATIQRNPSKHHIKQLQNLFQYVYATKEMGIMLDANPEMSIASDATNGADKGDRRSRIG
eukprot:CAMPEP_0173383234 /NCGR_PEP_ID=MMETSP1356-20130122/5789_1 /TAXON_ID=77927 ORGANISM="Hemiselmis virescens, Strain PCC157" /NCGR_SAMPLE_ID=MMETSP1356 /ASSEMBLY_ACC=CAM_ASM_000847 /LENGTH=117 /DNA_ID=CAMNT_0014337999 /DNA_START=41 /DNA_END=391 /DNA_ORIENTATION=+